MNSGCSGCVLWSAYGKKCYYFWEGKAFCASKCETAEEFENMVRLRSRS